ncbi:hypothetical protein BV22DRAFT_1134631 [Leucogyrophana mollusca]|uniref:Uncharacterized protein n=1 Tax=Leucogyrophana mollusca TaxID=85980 RepID=A0ACB8AYA8_9AGAM|nr:hypothetical protein BV22DRAFT_1134631 [Leucogyrophana mollusca]
MDHERMIDMNAWDTYEASSIGPKANDRLQTASQMVDELASAAVETACEMREGHQWVAHRLHLHYQGEGSGAESEEDSTPSSGPAWVLASDEADTSTNEVEQLLTEPVRCTCCVGHSSGNSSHEEGSEQLHAMHEAKAPEERQ